MEAIETRLSQLPRDLHGKRVEIYLIASDGFTGEIIARHFH